MIRRILEPYRIVKSRLYPTLYRIKVKNNKTISLNGLTDLFNESELKEIFGIEV